eukprot:1357448-Pyramimonas_sp.AAC.1
MDIHGYTWLHMATHGCTWLRRTAASQLVEFTDCPTDCPTDYSTAVPVWCQVIDDLTREKYELERAMRSHALLVATLAEENLAIAERVN